VGTAKRGTLTRFSWDGRSGPVGLVEESAVPWHDAQDVERLGPGGACYFDPLQAAPVARHDGMAPKYPLGAILVATCLRVNFGNVHDIETTGYLFIRPSNALAMSFRVGDTVTGMIADGAHLANPWLDLPESPRYVLPADLAVLRKFPKAMSDLFFVGMPGPFIGNPLSARVILLALHPGFVDSDLEAAGNEAIQGPWLEALQLREGAIFHTIHPDQEAAGGSPWWPKKLRRLIEAVGAEAVMEHVAAVEWFPYVSRRLVEIPELLPSQKFAFEVVRGALKRGAQVIIMIGGAQWLKSVPELGRSNLITIRNWQNPTITPGNMEPGEWERVVGLLSA
jgi:hypothetical protein